MIFNITKFLLFLFINIYKYLYSRIILTLPSNELFRVVSKIVITCLTFIVNYILS